MIENNYIGVIRAAQHTSLRVEGVRIFGTMGRRVIVREGRVVAALARRVLIVQRRRSQLLLPTFLLPLMLLAVIASGTSAGRGLRGFPDVAAYMATFSTTTTSEAAVVRALFGEIPISGRMPVSIPGYAKIGDGIQTTAVRPASSN